MTFVRLTWILEGDGSNDVNRQTPPKYRLLMTGPSQIFALRFHKTSVEGVVTLDCLVKLPSKKRKIGQLWSQNSGIFHYKR